MCSLIYDSYGIKIKKKLVAKKIKWSTIKVSFHTFISVEFNMKGFMPRYGFTAPCYEQEVITLYQASSTSLH